MMAAFGRYQARDEGQGTRVLPASDERVTLGEVPGDGHISGDVLP